jgi:Domain of unknown function (DUF4149)
MEIAAGLLLALVLGGMAFFSFLFSPLVFIKLPMETAGPFIRQVFPWYFLTVAGLFALAAAALAFVAPALALLAAAMAVLGLLNHRVLMPRINRQREALLAGDASASKAFDKLHRRSVGINLLQLAGAALALAIVLAP